MTNILPNTQTAVTQHSTNHPTPRRRVIVLGAGISGLSAAYYLAKESPEIELSVWEKSVSPGGVLTTVHNNGFQIERSADNFITTEPWAIDLCKEIGLGNDIVPTDTKFRRTFVVHRGKLYPLPDGFLMMAPTRLLPLATTPLLSPFGKLRAGLELLLPRHEKQDESIEHFVSRRLGREVYENIVEPLASGIYAGDSKRLSVWATLPRFPQMEVNHRSLILAVRKQMKAARTFKKETESGARYSFFVAMRSGLSNMAATLADRLPPGTLQTSREAASLHRKTREDGAPVWIVTDIHGNSQECDALICALPSPEVAELFAEISPEIATCCGQIEHSGAAVLTVALRTDQITRPMNGMGFVVPEKEGLGLIAGSFSSYKYPHRAPEGTVLLRLFAGGSRMPDLPLEPDDILVPRILAELRPLLGLRGDPLFVDVARWPNVMPQYNIGHLDLIARLERELERIPELALAGNAFYGVGIPSCIHSGRLAAERVTRASGP
ncbi:MAG: protoporphyrinogen oxidase [Planctomycetia bacterium]|nr:protoporphyrinogen oxidase [Planctomycetia bacterium]